MMCMNGRLAHYLIQKGASNFEGIHEEKNQNILHFLAEGLHLIDQKPILETLMKKNGKHVMEMSDLENAHGMKPFHVYFYILQQSAYGVESIDALKKQ